MQAQKRQVLPQVLSLQQEHVDLLQEREEVYKMFIGRTGQPVEGQEQITDARRYLQINIPEEDVEYLLQRLGIDADQIEDPNIQNLIIIAAVLSGLDSGITRALSPSSLLYLNMKQTNPAIRLFNAEACNAEEDQREAFQRVQTLVYAALLILGKSSNEQEFTEAITNLVGMAKAFSNAYNTNQYSNLNI